MEKILIVKKKPQTVISNDKYKNDQAPHDAKRKHSDVLRSNYTTERKLRADVTKKYLQMKLPEKNKPVNDNGNKLLELLFAKLKISSKLYPRKMLLTTPSSSAT